MAERIRNEYTPDYGSPPGETLLEALADRDMSQAELARRTGRPKKTINEIVKGKTAITPETALQLERALGIPARFWNRRQQQYDQYQAERAEDQRLRRHLDWLRHFPIKAMCDFRWMAAMTDEVAQLRELLNFLGIASPEQWQEVRQAESAFRKTAAYASDRYAVEAWLRQGEIMAQQIQCRPFAAATFRRTLVEEIRPLTVESPEVFQQAVVDLCAGAGVAVAFVPQLPGARVSGATRWLAPDKALIQLSLRYKTDDHLWFSFFHEAGHILLHGKRDVFIEGEEVASQQEQEADTFAAELLIPPREYDAFLATLQSGRYPSTDSVINFSERIGVAPGIVVGRLQHDGQVPYTHFNTLKRRLQWVHE